MGERDMLSVCSMVNSGICTPQGVSRVVRGMQGVLRGCWTEGCWGADER